MGCHSPDKQKEWGIYKSMCLELYWEAVLAEAQAVVSSDKKNFLGHYLFPC